MKNIKTHLFTYNYEGAEYCLEIPANSLQEAKDRLSRMTFAKYDGELVSKIPAIPTAGLFVKFMASIRNRLIR